MEFKIIINEDKQTTIIECLKTGKKKKVSLSFTIIDAVKYLLKN